jgi:hypothetical protein
MRIAPPILLTILAACKAGSSQPSPDASASGTDAAAQSDATPGDSDAAPWVCTPDSHEDDNVYTDARVPDFNLVDVVTYDQNSICQGDEDWFYVYLFGTETIEVKASFEQMGVEGDLDVLIYYAEQEADPPALLTDCSEANPGGCSADTGQSRTSGESFTYTAVATGHHYFKVRGWMSSENDYAICFALYGAHCN